MLRLTMERESFCMQCGVEEEEEEEEEEVW